MAGQHKIGKSIAALMALFAMIMAPGTTGRAVASTAGAMTYDVKVTYQRTVPTTTVPTPSTQCPNGSETVSLSEDWTMEVSDVNLTPVGKSATSQSSGSGTITGSVTEDDTEKCPQGGGTEILREEYAWGKTGEQHLTLLSSGAAPYKLTANVAYYGKDGLPGTIKETQTGGQAATYSSQAAPFDDIDVEEVSPNDKGVFNVTRSVALEGAGGTTAGGQVIAAAKGTLTISMTPSGGTPQAHCDVYQTSPGSTLKVPMSHGVLAIDSDGTGPGLTAHVYKLSFGVSEHHYSLAPNGALSLSVGNQPGFRTLEIAYYDTDDATGNTSNIAVAAVVIDDKSLGKQALQKYCSETSGTPSQFSSLFGHCTTTQLTPHSVTIHAGKINGKIVWGSKQTNKNNVCLHESTPKNTWDISGLAYVQWTGTPKVPTEIGLDDSLNSNGWDLSAGIGFPPGVSLGAAPTAAQSKGGDYRSNSAYAAVKFYSSLSAVDASKLTQTVTPYIALPGYQSNALFDPLGKKPAPAAHVCASRTAGFVSGLGKC